MRLGTLIPNIGKLSWSILPRGRGYWDAVASPEITRLAQLAQSFFRMFCNRHLAALPHSLKLHKGPHWRASPPICNGTSMLLRSPEQPSSQRHVEGQVHRLKLIKRHMYGRAGFDLLQLRILQQG